ncbi:MAG: hypothetical protein IKS47_05545 [Bacteroidales bacterium]|nr:hypothetical protein [Bacteroidales bacterium]
MRRTLILFLITGLLCPGLFAQDIDALLASMSRREKIAQIIIDAIDSQEEPALRARHEQWVLEGLGGLIVMDDGLAANMQMINELQSLSRIPMIVSIDGEWGAAMRYYEYAAFPRAMQLGALDNEELVEAAGRAIGEQLGEIKIFINYAPVVDVNNNPRNPVINTRSFGEDRERVARLGAAFVRGMQGAGVYGSAKHFPGHGDTDVDSHLGLPVLPFDRARLDSLELYPFRRLIDEGVAMVMVGHLSVPALDPTGTPASISRPIVTGLLREEMGFQGIIITDALGMRGVADDNANAALEAYRAGADILLMPQDTKETIDELDAAFRSGELDEAELDIKVRKMLLLKQKAGMLAPDYSPYVDTTALLLKTVRPETEVLIQRLCDRSMTVVRGKLRRPLTLHRRMAWTRRPKVAYVAYNAVTPESEAFYKELSRHGKVARFDLPGDATPQQIDSVEALLKGYRKVIVGIHSGSPKARSGGPQRFATIAPEQFERMAAWSRRHQLHGVFLGNPYQLNVLNDYTRFKTFVIGYSDTRYNNIAAARALTEYRSARGSLPVGAGGLPAGYHSNRIR